MMDCLLNQLGTAGQGMDLILFLGSKELLTHSNVVQPAVRHTTAQQRVVGSRDNPDNDLVNARISPSPIVYCGLPQLSIKNLHIIKAGHSNEIFSQSVSRFILIFISMVVFMCA
jgi:hypothetical protein